MTSAFTKTIERFDASTTEISSMFTAGLTPVRAGVRSIGTATFGEPEWNKMLLEAQRFVGQVVRNERPLWQLKEAMSTDAFKAIFADSLDRQLYGAYTAAPASWRNYVRKSTVNDFKQVKRFATTGIRGILKRVPELSEHERRTMEEMEFGYAVEKFEAGFGYSFEAAVNDDLNMFTRLPQDLSQSAIDSEEFFVTGLYAGPTGPNAALYSSGNDNVIASNAALTRASLQAAITRLKARKDERGNPIVVNAVELVVGTGLELRAKEILDAKEYRMVDGSGNVTILSGNGVSANLRLNVNYWLGTVSTTNADTSWYLFANPDNSARPALEVGFLRGYEAPQLYEKIPDMRRIGGGGEVPWSYEHGSMEKKIQHIFGGSQVDPRMTLGSNGTGTP